MADTSSSTPVAAGRADRPQPTLPEERFWIHYSPHGEMPLSSVTSFVIHALIIGLAILAVWSTSRFFDHPTRSLPIQTVQIAGGGGQPEGTADGHGTGTSQLKEVGGAASSDPEPGDSGKVDQKLPDLPTPEGTPKDLPFKEPNPTLEQGDSQVAINSLREQSGRIGDSLKHRPQRPAAPAAQGRGGSGSGGGQGTGRGTGTGSGSGPGKSGNLTRTQKRMLRWTMIFDTHSGPDYVRQLASLGAVLAFPVKEGPAGADYRVVTNKNLLNPPARLVNEDLSKYKGLHWTDDNATSLQLVMQTLGLHLRHPPTHFVAFMPPELEEKLAQLEKAYANRAEDDIFETRFRIVPTAGGYEPQVVDQKSK